MSFEAEPEKLSEYEPLTEAEWRVLYEKADCGNPSEILSELHETGLYERAFETFKHNQITPESTIESTLASAPPLLEKDWDGLLTLWLYDKETAYHSLRTYLLMHRILLKRSELAKAIETEGVQVNQEELIAILHDRGKSAIPRSVLNNKMSQKEAEKILFEKLRTSDPATLAVIQTKLGESSATQESVQQALSAGFVRPIRLLPIEYVVAQEERAELERRGFEVEGKTLMDVIDQHEQFTGKWLKDDHPVESEIAGHHHHPRESRYQTSSGLLGITSNVSAELVTVLDEIDAITSARSYKKAVPAPIAFVNELRRCERGELSEFVTYQVLVELMQDIAEEENAAYPDQVQKLQDFIASYEAKEKEESR